MSSERMAAFFEKVIEFRARFRGPVTLLLIADCFDWMEFATAGGVGGTLSA